MHVTLDRIVPQLLKEFGEVLAEVSQAEFDSYVQRIISAPRVFIFGAGRAGISSRAFAMRLTQIGKTTYWVNDDTTPSFGSGDLLVANSGSGESKSTLDVVSQAKQAGGTIAAITANPNGRIVRLADTSILLPAQGYKTESRDWRSILPLGSQFEACLWVLQDILCLAIVEGMRVDESVMMSRHRNLE